MVDGHWRPVGDPLPAFAHAPPDPRRVLAPWVLPHELQPAAGDIIAWAEQAFRLLTRLEADDEAVQTLWRQTTALHSHEDTQRWFATIEVWMAHRLSDGTTWPDPPT